MAEHGRLIDADALKEHIDKLPALPDGNFAGNHSALKALINMQPTIEPERKNGKWIYTPTEPLGYTCSVCKKGSCRFNFCPNCGAEMEGSQNLEYADNDTAYGGLQSAT